MLSAATGASKPAGAPTQTVKISGTLSAAGKKKGTEGGTILVTGENIKLASARIDASGRKGGGKVLIGGDWGGGNPNTSLVKNSSAKLESFVIPTATTVSVDAATTINASATGHGNGGKVVLWSDSETTFAGTILARGGAKSGDGGFVETSSHGQLAFTGNVDTRAPRGKAGTLLLDPEDIHIVSSCDGPCQPSTITAAQIEAQLSNQNVVIATNLALPVQLLAFTEGVLLAEKSGIPREVALEVLLNSVAASPMLQYRGPFVLKMPDEAWFNVNMMQKDMQLALELGRQVQVPLPTTSIANEFLTAARAMGLAEQDFAIIFKVLEKISGVPK